MVLIENIAGKMIFSNITFESFDVSDRQACFDVLDGLADESG